MTTNAQKEQLCEYFNELLNRLSTGYNWQWEESKQAWLAEFSRDKIAQTLAILEQYFDDNWDNKSIKKAPKSLKIQLGNFKKLSKQQKLFTTPAKNDLPTLVALWWPWGHGGTVSLRLITLEESYQVSLEKATKDNLYTRIKSFFN